MLRLDAGVEDVAFRAGIVEDALEVHARVVGVRLVVDVEVGGEPRDALRPRTNAVRVEVDASKHVVGVRPLPHSPYRRPGETRALVDDVVEVRHRHHLHLRRAVDIHELREDVLDAVLAHLLPYLLSVGHDAALLL